MKLSNFKRAQELLEILIQEGDKRLKFYLRLANCYEELGEIEKAITVLDKRALLALEKETQSDLKKKYNQMLKNLKKKQRDEKSKQDDLFKKCFTLKSNENLKNSVHNTISEKKAYQTDSYFKSFVQCLLKVIPSGIISLLIGMSLKTVCPNYEWKALSFGNFGMISLIRENYNQQKKQEMILNSLMLFSLNAFWIKKFIKDSA